MNSEEYNKLRSETIRNNDGFTLENLYDDAFENGKNFGYEYVVKKTKEFLEQNVVKYPRHYYEDIDTSIIDKFIKFIKT